jgi:hypothetical protein
MEEGLFRRRSQVISAASALGYRYRFSRRCTKDAGLQDLPPYPSRARQTRGIHQGEFGKGVHPPIQIPVFIPLLRWKEGWEITSSNRLQEAQFVHGARLIPPPTYPRTSG